MYGTLLRMADKITFTEAVLRHFGRSSNIGSATFSASLTDKVLKALEIGDIPEFLSGATLDKDLHATTFELTPSERELAKHGFELEISRANKFSVVRLELDGKRGKGHRQELRFTVTFADKNGCRKLEQYMTIIGEGKGRLSISYTKQEVLPEVEATEDQRQAVLAEE